MNDSRRRPRRPYPGLVASTEVRRSLLIGPLVPPRLPSLRCAVCVVRSLLPASEKRVAAHEECVGRPRCSTASPIVAFVPFRIHARSHREQRLARCVFHFVRPGLLDAVDDVLRHRDVIELLGHLVALVVGPGEELERLGGGRRILRLLIEQCYTARGAARPMLRGVKKLADNGCLRSHQVAQADRSNRLNDSRLPRQATAAHSKLVDNAKPGYDVTWVIFSAAC